MVGLLEIKGKSAGSVNEPQDWIALLRPIYGLIFQNISRETPPNPKYTASTRSDSLFQPRKAWRSRATPALSASKRSVLSR